MVFICVTFKPYIDIYAVICWSNSRNVGNQEIALSWIFFFSNNKVMEEISWTLPCWLPPLSNLASCFATRWAPVTSYKCGEKKPLKCFGEISPQWNPPIFFKNGHVNIGAIGAPNWNIDPFCLKPIGFFWGGKYTLLIFVGPTVDRSVWGMPFPIPFVVFNV